MKVVLDTNIYISALVFKGGNCAKIIELADRKKFELFSSLFIIDELGGVLRRKFGWSKEQITIAQDEIGEVSQLTPEPDKIVSVVDHPADNQILSCCLLADADYLVTGDKRHLLPLGEFKGTKIMSPADFLKEIRA